MYDTMGSHLAGKLSMCQVKASITSGVDTTSKRDLSATWNINVL